ncbi:hypothetical protein MAV100_08560 [Mycobacterium avium subsp. hominissuis 100]|nr:hypothetical protein MAV100_08560 [Mycobacterium avium subsp. hominissuis 100]
MPPQPLSRHSGYHRATRGHATALTPLHGTWHPSVMPMDAWRDGEQFIVEFDLPGIDEQSLDLDIERNAVTVRAERPDVDPGREMLATERPRGVFSRQLVLGDNLDTDRIEATYTDGVLRLRIPVAEKAKPRKIAVSRNGQAAVNA